MSQIRAKVQLGCENFLENYVSRIKGRKTGLVTNPTGADSHMRSLVDVFFEHPSIDLFALFSPEHGIRGSGQAGQFIPFYTDRRTGLPVFSLYGQSSKTVPGIYADLDEGMRSFDTIGKGKRPGVEMLEGLDVLVYDIQDVGTRIYTYISTMAYCMQACAELSIEFIVLDRPNPINGMDMEGPVLDYPAFSSFVGMYPVPVRYGMTAGEMARMFNDRFLAKKVDLTVIPMKRWKREMWFDQTNLPWVAPSPNMPRLQTAVVYPGQVFLEGTNVSEGRGTTQPFEILGAPWIDGFALAEELNRLRFPGVMFREAWFIPSFSKYEGQTCCGIQLHITDREVFKSFQTALHIIKLIRDRYPQEFRFYDHYFDKMMGTDKIRKAIKDGLETDAIDKGCSAALDDFSKQRKKYLIY